MSIPKIKKEIVTEQDYVEISVEKIKLKQNTKEIVYELKIPEIKNIFLLLDLDKETAELKIDNKKIKTDLNFTYDILQEDAIKDIKILANKNGNIIFLFPVATEEYLTFQIIKYDKLKMEFSDSNFHFETFNNIHQIYSNSKSTLSEKNDNYNLKIDSYEFTGNFSHKNEYTLSKKSDTEFNGSFSVCIPDKRMDTIKSETCYEILIKSNNASIEGNSSICSGKYSITHINENEINLIPENNLNCQFKIKKSVNKYYIQIKNSDNWQELIKDK